MEEQQREENRLRNERIKVLVAAYVVMAGCLTGASAWVRC
jgi:hypothetical protein